MTSAKERAVEAGARRAFANAIMFQPTKCPWNPFPSNSPWGRKIDEVFTKEQSERATRARIQQMAEAL